MKRTIPLLITFFVGFILIVAYFVPWFGDLGELAAIHFDILAAIAFILGGGNLLRTHGEKIYKGVAGWGYSLIAVVTFLTMLTFGLGKCNVEPDQPGLWTNPPMRSGDAVGLAQLDIDPTKGEQTLTVVVRKAEPGPHAVFVNGAQVGEIDVDADGSGRLAVKHGPDSASVQVGDSTDVVGVATPDRGLEAADAPEERFAVAALADVSLEAGADVRVGDALAGRLESFAWYTGTYNDNGSFFWWLYEYGFQPLQQTTFAMLAFYVASAAFRAFRAKNFESVLLLGTAFIILLGRTFVGTWATGFLVDPGQEPEGMVEQILSFFYIPNLTSWIMSVFNTAGNRAIMIGIALGVASTSLKVLLGIDRSYLGSDKG